MTTDPAVLIIHQHPNADDDAALILAFIIASGTMPLLTPLDTRADRIQRAITRAKLTIRRQEDEHAGVIAQVNAAVDTLADAAQAIAAADTLEARGHAMPEPPRPARPTTPPRGPRELAPTPPPTRPSPSTYASVDF